MGTVWVVVCAVGEVVPDLPGAVEGTISMTEESDVVSAETPSTI